MPLTELIIDGFKSFADKTKIEFNSGITGIVGPNGSGKSNITEAIRWVMGEASAKSLRGSNMKDVIFAGSEFRQPTNHAEVSMTFDNRNHELNLAAETVTITRRILRSGESEYLINKHNVRQRDVKTLFLDSGISQNSLSIISQGRVDQILNSRPEKRRSLFEEAAGVLSFKKQKEEANNQLKQTSDNLVRINDVVKELQQRLEPLHEQSSLAKEYQFQKNGLNHDLKTLLAFEIETIDGQKKAVQKKAEKNQVLLSKLDCEVKESQKAVASKRAEYKKISTQREQIQQDLLALTKKLSKINTDLQVAEQSKQYNEATKKEYQAELADINGQVKELKQECAELSVKEQKLKTQRQQLKDQRKKLTLQLDANPEQLNQNLDNLRAEYIQLLQDQTSNNNDIAYLNAELKRTVADQPNQNNDVTKQLDHASVELKRLGEQSQLLKQKSQNKQITLTELITQKNDNQSKLSNVQQILADNNQRYREIKARFEALENIRKRHEGYYYGVKNVLNNLDNYPGVIGVVGELISFPIELEAAMTTALGGGVQDLVTSSKLSARDAINQLKNDHAGRATFLPLDGLNEYTIPISTKKILNSYPGYQGVASELVKATVEQDITPAINYLLGSTIIVDTIDNALKMHQRIARYRIVTLDGDVVSPGGSMTGGARNQKNNSPLQTVAELNQLKTALNKLEKQLKKDQVDYKELASVDQKLSQEITEVQEKCQNYKQELAEVALSYQSQEREVARLAKANKLFKTTQKQRQQQLKELQTKINFTKNKKVTFVEQIEQQKAKIGSLQEKIQNFTALNQHIQAQLADLDPKIAVYTNKLENIAKQQVEKQRRLTQYQAQIKNLTNKLNDISHNRELDQKKKQILEAQTKADTGKQAELQQQVTKLSAQLGQFDAKIGQLDQVASRNYDLRKNAANEQENFSVQIAQLNSRIDQRLEQLSKDYSLTYEAALAQADLENDEQTRTKLQKSVKLHQMSLKDTGPVNLKAIEEYEDVKQRFDFLSNQQNDLLSGRDNLRKSMAELDQEVCVRFNKTFNEVAKNFMELFPIVFGGGKAKLVLTAPADLLNTGIEIIAQPPGKKQQSLSLLSGGERALTAITLLFAMLKVKPVPFCVLDEVEAALDDANVTRFAQFLEKYDLHTQFIVITHRRGTMEQADQLYGVVMQESGVSQVLSVSLKEIKNEVN